MSHRIQKLALDPRADTQRVHVPEGSVGLGLRLAGDTPTVWMLAPDDAPLLGVTVYRIGAHAEVPEFVRQGQHIGMVQEHAGAPVWHYFVVLDAQPAA